MVAALRRSLCMQQRQVQHQHVHALRASSAAPAASRPVHCARVTPPRRPLHAARTLQTHRADALLSALGSAMIFTDCRFREMKAFQDMAESRWAARWQILSRDLGYTSGCAERSGCTEASGCKWYSGG